MLLTEGTATTPLDKIEADSPRPIAKRRKPVRKILTAAAAIFVAATVAGVAIVQTSGPVSRDRTTQPDARSRDDLVSHLVNGGVVPAATLESAPPSREDLVRDLVARGVVPAATLEPAPPSREDLVRDLVARGLIPAATLD
jgi:hypothetical protein